MLRIDAASGGLAANGTSRRTPTTILRFSDDEFRSASSAASRGEDDARLVARIAAPLACANWFSSPSARTGRALIRARVSCASRRALVDESGATVAVRAARGLRGTVAAPHLYAAWCVDRRLRLRRRSPRPWGGHAADVREVPASTARTARRVPPARGARCSPCSATTASRDPSSAARSVAATARADSVARWRNSAAVRIYVFRSRPGADTRTRMCAASAPTWCASRSSPCGPVSIAQMRHCGAHPPRARPP